MTPRPTTLDRSADPLLVRAATACGVGIPLRLSPAAFGEAGRRRVSRYELPVGELDLSGQDARAGPDGPAPRGSRALSETHLRLPAG